MMETVLKIDKVKLLATEAHNENFFHRIFINQVRATNEGQQQRQNATPQRVWCTVGCGTSIEEELLTTVLALCRQQIAVSKGCWQTPRFV